MTDQEQEFVPHLLDGVDNAIEFLQQYKKRMTRKKFDSKTDEEKQDESIMISAHIYTMLRQVVTDVELGILMHLPMFNEPLKAVTDWCCDFSHGEDDEES